MDLIIATMVNNMHDRGYDISAKELACVSQNVYFEARGESIMDQTYVANVTMNRVHDKENRWPKTACGVVFEPYQFSWTLDKDNLITAAKEKIESSKDKQELWKQIVETSAYVMTGVINDQTNGANHYHRRDVHPKWSNDYKVCKLPIASVHIFYTDKDNTQS